MAGHPSKEPKAELDRVLPGRMGELVDDDLHDLGRMTVTDRAPPQDGNTFLSVVNLGPEVCDRVRGIRHALDAPGIDVVSDHHGFEGGSEEDRLCDDRLMPARDAAAGIEACPHAMIDHRSVVAPADIVLSGANQMDRCTAVRRLQ